MSLSISPTQTNLFVSVGDSTAILWDIRTNRSVKQFKWHTADVNTVEFHPSGFSFATGSDDCSCKLFDIRMNGELMSYSDPKEEEGITSLSFSKSGTILFVGSGTNLSEWHTLSGVKKRKIESGTRFSTVCVSPNGSALAAGSWDHMVRICS